MNNKQVHHTKNNKMLLRTRDEKIDYFLIVVGQLGSYM